MAYEIASVVTCKMCGRNIAGPGLVIGAGQQSGRLGAFLQSIAQHIMNDHPEEYKLLEAQTLEYKGLLFVTQYTTKDERFQHQRNWLRWRIHQATLNARFPNDKIDTKSGEFADYLVSHCIAAMAKRASQQELTEAVKAKIVELVKMVRDELQEPNEPQLPAQKPVLTTH